jgi:DNA-binding Lrp family transcriptional regulator
VSIIITAEVWQYAPIGKGDLLVLLRIADAAGDDHRMMWESVKTLAKRTRMSERGVYNSLRNLEKQNIIESVPKDVAPPEASLYASVVRRIRPVQEWLDEPGAAVVDMQNLQDPNQDKTPLKKLHPAQVSYNPSISTRSNRDTSYLQGDALKEAPPEDVTKPGAKGWEAVQPLRRGGRKKSRKQQAEEAAQAERELDPAYVVARALDEDAPSPTLYGDPEALDAPSAPPVQRTPKRRSLRPSEVLAEFFDRRAQEVGHPVPGTTNLGALSGNFGRWMAQGTDKNEIRRMIITYWSPSWNRSENVVAWKDFLAARGLLTGRRDKAEKADEVENNRFNEDYWT